MTSTMIRFRWGSDNGACFCPPKVCYDAVRNADGRYGTPMPPFSDLIEQGKFGEMVSLKGNQITHVPLSQSMRNLKTVDPELIRTAEIFYG